MDKQHLLTQLVYEGKVFRIEFYVRPSGDVLAEEWLESMSDSMQAKFAALCYSTKA